MPLHGQDHRPGGPDPVPARAVMHIKVFGDADVVTAGDGAFIFAVSEDMDGAVLSAVELAVSTESSSGIVQVQLRNITQAVDMLSTRVQIDANELDSKDASTAAVINPANAAVAWGDQIAVDVDAAGTDAMGLEVHLDWAGVQVLEPGVLEVDVATQEELDAHITDTTDAHAASAVGITDTGAYFTGTTVEAALQEIGAGGIGIPDAEDIPFTPAGTIAATDVQAAIEEVAAEAGGGGGLFDAYALLQHQEAANTNGGTFNSGSWVTRPLTTEVFDPDGIVTLSSNQFDLAAGTYFIDAWANALAVNIHQTRLRDVDNGVTLAVGSLQNASASAGAAARSRVTGRFTLSGTTTLELQHRCQTSVSSIGFGQTAGDWGEVGVFAQVEIWREG